MSFLFLEFKMSEPTVVVDNLAIPESITFSNTVASILKNGTVAQRTLVTFLERYVEKMKPGAVISDIDGSELQYQLWKQIWFIAEQAPIEEFNRLWNILISYYREYKSSVFGIQYVNRFPHAWSYDPQMLTSLQRVNHLLMTSVRDRANLHRRLDMTKVLAFGFSEQGRGRILNFYN